MAKHSIHSCQVWSANRETNFDAGGDTSYIIYPGWSYPSAAMRRKLCSYRRWGAGWFLANRMVCTVPFPNGCGCLGFASKATAAMAFVVAVARGSTNAMWFSLRSRHQMLQTQVKVAHSCRPVASLPSDSVFKVHHWDHRDCCLCFVSAAPIMKLQKWETTSEWLIAKGAMVLTCTACTDYASRASLCSVVTARNFLPARTGRSDGKKLVNGEPARKMSLQTCIAISLVHLDSSSWSPSIIKNLLLFWQSWLILAEARIWSTHAVVAAGLTTDCSNNASSKGMRWNRHSYNCPLWFLLEECRFTLPQQQTASLKATHLSSLSSTLQLPAKHGIISGHVAHTAQEFNGNLACGAAFRLHKIGSREVLQDLPNTFCRGKQPPRGVTVKWASVSMLFGPLARSMDLLRIGAAQVGAR